MANGRQYGNGTLIAPAAALDDGRLDVVVVEGRSPLATLLQAPRLFSGRIASAPGVTSVKAMDILVMSDRPVRNLWTASRMWAALRSPRDPVPARCGWWCRPTRHSICWDRAEVTDRSNLCRHDISSFGASRLPELRSARRGLDPRLRSLLQWALAGAPPDGDARWRVFAVSEWPRC
jgi:hypothetical protein